MTILFLLTTQISFKFVDLVTHQMVCGLFVTLEKLDLAPELFHLDDRSFLEDGLLGRVPFNVINLFSLDSVDFVHEQVRLIFLGRSRLQLLILVAKRLDYLI